MAKSDEEAWRVFHRDYFRRLHRYLIVLQRGDDDAAAELVQLTLLRVVRHVRAFQCEQVFWSWLTCLARYAAADEGRKRKRRRLLAERFQHWQEQRRAGNRDAEQWRCEQLTQCLESLSDIDRQLIEGKYFERCSYGQLANTLGMSAKAVESRLSRLRKKLRVALEVTGGDH